MSGLYMPYPSWEDVWSEQNLQLISLPFSNIDIKGVFFDSLS